MGTDISDITAAQIGLNEDGVNGFEMNAVVIMFCGISNPKNLRVTTES